MLSRATFFLKPCRTERLPLRPLTAEAASVAESEIAAVVAKHGMRAVALPFRSTAENLARHFHEQLATRIAGLSAVRVWETPDSCAEYRQ